METVIHQFVAQARAGTLARVIARLRSGWAVLGDPQVLRGYCLLYPDPVVTDLHELAPVPRLQFLDDLGRLGQAVFEVTGARRINYEMLGNVEPALHAHVVPRYHDEAQALRLKPVWSYDWDAAPRFESGRDRALMDGIAAALARKGALPAVTGSPDTASDQVLREIAHVRQIEGEPRRRWFTSHDLDLIVWTDAGGTVVGFQLCYDKSRREHALTWKRGTGFVHEAVDDGEGRPGKYKGSPILVPDGDFSAVLVVERFRAQSAGLDAALAGFVCDKLLQYPAGRD